jgi:hypothetical protein
MAFINIRVALLVVAISFITSCGTSTSPVYFSCVTESTFSPTKGSKADNTSYLFRYNPGKDSLTKLQVDGRPLSLDINYSCSDNELRIMCMREDMGTSWAVFIVKDKLEFEEATVGVDLKGDIYMSTDNGKCSRSLSIS